MLTAALDLLKEGMTTAAEGGATVPTQHAAQALQYDDVCDWPESVSVRAESAVISSTLPASCSPEP